MESPPSPTLHGIMEQLYAYICSICMSVCVGMRFLPYNLNSQIIISEDDLISEKRHMFVLKMYY